MLSSDVIAGNIALATDYNKLRADVINISPKLPQLIITTIFDVATRFITAVTGSASLAWSYAGVNLSTGITGLSKAVIVLLGQNLSYLKYDRNSYFSFGGAIIQYNPNFMFYFGVGNEVASTGDSITLTTKQFGFKMININDTLTISATNANGTTETATALSGVTYEDKLWHAQKNGTTNIKFYIQGVLKATHTTNLPSGTSDNRLANIILNNRGATNDVIANAGSFNYSQDAQTEI